MIDYKCKKCLWWDSIHPYVKTIPMELEKTNPGLCRKHKPGALAIGRYYYGVQPVMDAEEFCGEFRGG